MDTQQKYHEAEYFLEMMKENIDDHQKFKYSISAFVSAARSVTFVLQEEISKNLKFDEWYCQKQMQMKKDGLFKFFNKSRITVIHEEGTVDMRREIKIEVPPIRVRISAISVEAIVKNTDGTIKDYEYSESPVEPKITPKQDDKEITEYKWFFKNCPDEYRNVNVITLCKKYLNELNIIVEEAESKFGKANTS